MGSLMGKYVNFIQSYCPCSYRKKVSGVLFPDYLRYHNETLQLCLSTKVTYYDKETSLRLFQFMSYLPLIDPKNVFLICSSITTWNF